MGIAPQQAAILQKNSQRSSNVNQPLTLWKGGMLFGETWRVSASLSSPEVDGGDLLNGPIWLKPPEGAGWRQLETWTSRAKDISDQKGTWGSPKTHLRTPFI